jgi:hypothetical protein
VEARREGREGMGLEETDCEGEEGQRYLRKKKTAFPTLLSSLLLSGLTAMSKFKETTK